MKKLVLVAVALAVCCMRDTESRETGRRLVVRLHGTAWAPCDKAPDGVNCDAAGELPKPEICGRPATKPAEALRQLEERGSEQCTDAAIESLRKFAAQEPRLRSDLAAAYYVRAKRTKRPSDLLRAYTEAAHTSDFNRALIEEELGLIGEAIETWKRTVATTSGDWRAEARERLARLEARPRRTTEREFRRELARVLAAEDKTSVAYQVQNFPEASEQYLTKVLLEEWAQNGDATVMKQATLLAAQFADRFANDAVQYAARVGPAVYKTKGPDNPVALLEKVRAIRDDPPPPEFLRQAAVHQWKRLAALVYLKRGYWYSMRGNFTESLHDFDDAEKLYGPHDAEQRAAVLRQKIGVYRYMGSYEQSLQCALGAIPLLPYTTQLRTRHTALGEAAESVAALGNTTVARLYLERAVQDILAELPAETDPNAIEGVQQNLSSVYRARALLRFQTGARTAAKTDMDEAVRLGMKVWTDPDHLNRLLSAAEDLYGRLALSTNPKQAIDHFNKAIEASRADPDLPAFGAAIRVELAHAYQRNGQPQEATAQLKQAIDDIKAKIQRTTARVDPKDKYQAEQNLSRYFDRFQEASAELIDDLMIANDPTTAFDYAERTRAAEPLYLLGTSPLPLRDIQASLPPDTAIVQYAVTATRTYAWIITHDRFDSARLGVGRSDIENWGDEVQRFARYVSKDAEMRTVLTTCYDRLLRNVLPKTGDAARLVFVPDGPMHALPFTAMYDRRRNRFVVQDKFVSTAGSSTLYVQSLERNRAMGDDPQPKALLIGAPEVNPEVASAYGLRPISQALKELEDVAALYTDRSLKTGTDANVQELLRNAPAASVVHIAAHGVANPNLPEHSFLLLADDAHQGKLDAQQLLSAKTQWPRTRLVILSACTSAGGVAVGPEGLAPLVRPFITAHVPGVIGSLWSVDDAPARKLMVSLHRHYRNDPADAAQALASAQREAIAEGRKLGAWAAFEVIGYASLHDATTAPQRKGETPRE